MFGIQDTAEVKEIEMSDLSPSEQEMMKKLMEDTKISEKLEESSKNEEIILKKADFRAINEFVAHNGEDGFKNDNKRSINNSYKF